MLRRGFKSWSETLSLRVRKDLGIIEQAPLDCFALAQYLGVRVWTPADIPALSSKTGAILLRSRADGWSAVSVTHNDAYAVVYNPSHKAGRRSSDIMHELSHIVIGHEPATILLAPGAGIALRSFNRDQEEEAAWLAGSLLLPRPALLNVARSATTIEAACDMYVVSDDLLEYRMNVTGVNAQMRHRRRLGSAPTSR